jgi:hypothetical protein
MLEGFISGKMRSELKSSVFNCYPWGAGKLQNDAVRSVTMKYRIAMWATAGFLVAGFWALFAFLTFPPSTDDPMRDVWTLVSLTCPVAIAGRHYPISLSETLVANAVTYALVGLMVETLRQQLRHAK